MDFVLPRMPLCIYVPYVHNPESALKILRTRWSSWKTTHRFSIPPMMQKTAVDSKAKGKKLGPTSCLVGAVRERMLECYSD